MRDMLRGTATTSAGPRYAIQAVRNDPPPVQPRLPILVGGGGEKVTLKLVARYADANNVGGGVENVRRTEAILLEHCETVGRDPTEIERTVGVGTVTIRDSRAEAQRVATAIFESNGGARPGSTAQIGTPEEIAEALAPYPAIGYRHLIADFPSPHDDESMTRFATEVRGLLERG
jgi:alkanesulfonate monooxygenase SsuD/methylene tetrahydromethanopterin reductase-like flavin-dependent oxidoreductase (luciferase family)